MLIWRLLYGVPENPRFQETCETLEEYGKLKYEYGSTDVERALAAAGRDLEQALARLKALPESAELRAREPDDLRAIRALHPEGPRRIWRKLDEARYMEKLQGALLGRMAGCTLGAPVELWGVGEMERWAEYIGDRFPNQRYWSRIKNPSDLRYGRSACEEYTLEKMDGVPVDDDIAYTLLGLLIAEDYGPDFTVEDVGKAWLKYLPFACTAEDVALKNLKKGVPAGKAAEVDNPVLRMDRSGHPVTTHGATLRRDTREGCRRWPGADACISHRRNGVYGEMFFSAAISAAFAVDDPLEALEIGLTEIPRDCALAADVRWALGEGAENKGLPQARAAVESASRV